MNAQMLSIFAFDLSIERNFGIASEEWSTFLFKRVQFA